MLRGMTITNIPFLDTRTRKGSRERLPGDPLDLGKIIVDEPSLGRGVALAHRVWPKLLS